MPDLYQLAPDVLLDLEAIFDYTIDRWGIEQAHRYKSKIVQHHYVFHLVRENQAPLIIAILHERMNMIDRIRNRLDH